ncbi:NERD domain-containing protein (plasmid) [Pontibacillus sp. ALD_SL1]|uniref:nuclease-related domain-containing protein n=1 Tax=Pontibacillus sp. ALD_SL1 TaxID=2777185 RepID=UPI001A95A0F5|nr:nuclease-related domain-containing protein [Pontibacillus sp. ALD_SL1]QST02991.1 NERD domain-containing protein [Pontibacillus sp. ALD_SL1]
MSVFSYNLIPLFILCPSLFLLFRLAIVRVSYHRGKGYVALALSGFSGFFLTFILAAYPPYYPSYGLLPYVFFCMFVAGWMGCLKNRVNPLSPGVTWNDPPTVSSSSFPLPVDQPSLDASKKAINRKLVHLPSPYRYLKEITLLHGDRKSTHDFIVIGPTGVFHVYPCNWTGTVSFTSTSVQRTAATKNDTKNYATTTEFDNHFLKRILKQEGFGDIEVTPVICMTHEDVKLKGFPSSYEAVHVEQVQRFIQSANKKKYSLEEIEDIERIFMNRSY